MAFHYNVYRGCEDCSITSTNINRDLKADEVFVEVTHGALCGTDIHYLTSGQALGHEGVGIVKQIGQGVKSVRPGDRVGLGYVQKICQHCSNCQSGWDQYCQGRQDYGKSDRDQGTFASSVIWNSDVLIPIPKALDSANASALMCGGATAWTVLSQYGIKKRERVGVMGIGGLGHLAIKMAAAMEFQVVALSMTESKREDCLRFGAHEFLIFDSSRPTAIATPLDHLLLCGSASVEIASLLPLMATHGTIYCLTVDLNPSLVPLLALSDNGIRIQGSFVASRKGVRDMLNFCAERKISAETEQYPLTSEGIENAAKALQNGQVRYKCVFHNPKAKI